jgi:ribosomal protein S18 acetylase RimI-like enzyme
MVDHGEVEALTPGDREEAGAVIARAFRDNPGMVAVAGTDDAGERLRLLSPAMPYFVEATIRHGVGEVVRNAGKIVAVSLATQPGGYPLPLRGRWLATRGALTAGIRRALRFGRLDDEMRRRHPHHRHWYLWFLAVDPPHQGRGLGSMLLRSLSRKADRDGVPCYLETDKPSSVRLYEKHGYKVSSDRVMKGLDFRMWFMDRPQTPPESP